MQDAVERSGTMKRICPVVLAALLLLGLQYPGSAADQNHPTKWSQTPDMNDGHQFASEVKVPSIVADDWICPDGRPVTDIHWWGGYWQPVDTGRYGHYSDGRPSLSTPGTLESFTISIWSSVLAGGSEPYSRPGIVLKNYSFGLAEAHEQYYGATVGGKHVYQYYVDLPEDDWFAQVLGTIYWLTIEATMSDPSVQWGWHESNEHRVSPAVQDFKDSGWVQIRNNLYANDMAFELTTIPEPAGLSVMAVGLGSMAAFLFRRRK